MNPHPRRDHTLPQLLPTLAHSSTSIEVNQNVFVNTFLAPDCGLLVPPVDFHDRHFVPSRSHPSSLGFLTAELLERRSIEPL